MYNGRTAERSRATAKSLDRSNSASLEGFPYCFPLATSSNCDMAFSKPLSLLESQQCAEVETILHSQSSAESSWGRQRRTGDMTTMAA
jgi:hypothetical protein